MTVTLASRFYKLAHALSGAAANRLPIPTTMLNAPDWKMLAILWMLTIGSTRPSCAQTSIPYLPHEVACLPVRNPESFPLAPFPATLPPTTVDDPATTLTPIPLPLDEAIRLALQNCQVVRVLTGIQASATGATLFDPSISATDIDAQRGRFDPIVQALQSFNRTELPREFFDPNDPARAIIGGVRSDDYRVNADLSKTSALGGTANVGVDTDRSRTRPGTFPLNPRQPSSLDLSYTQPLLRGAGIAVNQVPIVLARIDTERSFFRLKDAVQETVRSTIDGYWQLVAARVDLWVREQQVSQARWAFEQIQAQKNAQLILNGADLAQSRVALANFEASLIGSQSNVLLRETALRNLLALPPNDGTQFTPITPPDRVRLRPNWDALLSTAERYRPDIIELKLILDADRQLLLQANNQALPQLDAVGLYRWNGLEGEMLTGETLQSAPGQFTDWSVGVNFAVPLGLRQARAGLRRQELILARDRANLEQGMHSASHQLTIHVRNLAQFFRQYEAYRITREAATFNLQRQMAVYRAGSTGLLNVLQAITDWGNAVNSEAQSLLQYNTELANLSRQTGTILEQHGVRFFEERFASLGPLRSVRCYPAQSPPSRNEPQYAPGNEPSENAFRLEKPDLRALDRLQLPPPSVPFPDMP